MGVYARGTFRTTKKYLPQFIKFSKAETEKLPRGCFRLATNAKHNLSCYAWNDNSPVHVLSSADGTIMETTKRKSKSEKIDVFCPVAVKKYNQGMQGVDQFNKMLTLFSLANLKFDKYYKKIAMVLLDFAITNAFLHYRLANEIKKDSKYTRVLFMEKLQEQMINVDWSEKVRRYNMVDPDDLCYDSSEENYNGNQTFNKMMKIGSHSTIVDEVPKVVNLQKNCNPVAMQYSPYIGRSKNSRSISQTMKFLEQLPDSKRVCQICEYEGRGRRRTGVNYCPTHKIRACTLHHPDPKISNKFTLRGVVNTIDLTDDNEDWLCPDSSLTCWEKAHLFYIPNGLFHYKKEETTTQVGSPIIDFNVVSKINWSSKLSKKRKYQLKNEKKENKKFRKSYINCEPERQSSLAIQLSPELNKALPIPSFDESILKDNSSTESETSNMNFSQKQSQHIEKLLDSSEKHLNSIVKKLENRKLNHDKSVESTELGSKYSAKKKKIQEKMNKSLPIDSSSDSSSSETKTSDSEKNLNSKGKQKSRKNDKNDSY